MHVYMHVCTVNETNYTNADALTKLTNAGARTELTQQAHELH